MAPRLIHTPLALPQFEEQLDLPAAPCQEQCFLYGQSLGGNVGNVNRPFSQEPAIRMDFAASTEILLQALAPFFNYLRGCSHNDQAARDPLIEPQQDRHVDTITLQLSHECREGPDLTIAISKTCIELDAS